MNTTLTLTIAMVGLTLTLGLWAWGRYTRRELVWDFHTALHYHRGRFAGALDPGVHRLWGQDHTVIRVENRLQELLVHSQEMLTADSAVIKLSAVAQYRIVNAQRFYESTEDGVQTLHSQIQFALRDIYGALELDAILARQGGDAKGLRDLVVGSEAVQALGIEVQRVVVRDLMLGGELKGACSAVLTARKEAQAKQERARGDAAALRTMANAARVFESNPALMRMRALDTLKELGTGYNNTLYVGLPEELVSLASAVSKND